MHDLLVPSSAEACPVHLVTPDILETVLAGLTDGERAWVEAHRFEAKPGRHLVLPGPGGTVAGVLFGLDPASARRRDPLLPGRLPTVLPPGTYRFANALPDARLAAYAWLAGSYRFGRYKATDPAACRLVVPDGVDGEAVSRLADAVALGRDLIATPANDLGPEELEAAIRALAARHGARVRTIAGDDLLAENLPMVHAVGRASSRAPRLVDLTWGRDDHPKVTLVGKGVVFDTGGLNIKPDASMLLMKKDMGGAAAAIACAELVMGARLPVRLRLIVPAVENAISGSAFRPGDVLASRKGLSVEIGNTDAEGRLILADALALADEEGPDILVDFATLTGAARVALGPDLPPLFCHDDAFAAEFEAAAAAEADPVWRLPLWPPYDALLDSKIADVNHISGGPFAGAITAALFLNRFVERAGSYAHLDIFAWTPAARPGRPEGPEVMGARALFGLLERRHG